MLENFLWVRPCIRQNSQNRLTFEFVVRPRWENIPLGTSRESENIPLGASRERGALGACGDLPLCISFLLKSLVVGTAPYCACDEDEIPCVVKKSLL